MLDVLARYDPAVFVPAHFPAVTPGIVRLVLSLFIVYPLSYIHRELIHRKGKLIQLLYFLISGFAIIYYILGFRGTLHCFLNILGVWVAKKLLGPTPTLVIVAGAYTMTYLILGYIMNTRTEVYDVQWTTPHSIHTMKLIGLMFDYKDGNTDPEKLSEDQKKHAIKDFSLYELLAFCFTYTGGLTGPQISYKRFISFCDNKLPFEPDIRGRPNSVNVAYKKMSIGCLFLATYLFGGLFFNRDTVLSDEFAESNFLYRLFYCSVFGQIGLSKYIGCWTVMEGGCVLVGISYDSTLPDKWGATQSINLEGLYTGITNKSFIDNFNVTTKDWFIRYLFKRMKESSWGKWQSMCSTYLFIILWHGVHVGYFLAFLFEIPVIMVEKQITRVVVAVFGTMNKWHPATQTLTKVVAGGLRFCTIGYGIMPFILLTLRDTLKVYNPFYWFVHIFLLLWLVLWYTVIEHRLPPSQRQYKQEKLQ